MKSFIKQSIQSTCKLVVQFTGKTRLGRYCLDQLLCAAREHFLVVIHNGTRLSFAAPNALCCWRADTFSTKEPETLEWIDAMPKGSVLWDVGANVGLYTVYAAKKRMCQVWAFEPSVFNLELLARNIFLNDLTKQVCIVPMALSDKLASSQLRMTTTDWGGALSTFDKTFGWDGKSIRQVFEFQTLGLSMNDAFERLCIPKPEYLKMDVDGIEHLILSGGANILKSVREVLIEVNDDFTEQASQINKLLTESGLVLKTKRHSDIIASSTTGFANCFDQIWVRT